VPPRSGTEAHGPRRFEQEGCVKMGETYRRIGVWTSPNRNRPRPRILFPLLVPSIAAFQIANRNLKTLLRRSKIEDEDENDYD